MNRAICPGSFDPITYGHLDIITRGANIFDEVIVALAKNSAKKYLFNDQQRLDLVQVATAHLPNVKVVIINGLIADFAKECEANVILKGLRGAKDFFNEESMAILNQEISGIDTAFILGNPALSHISSSYVKEIAVYQGKIDKLVPENVAVAVFEKMKLSKDLKAL